LLVESRAYIIDHIINSLLLKKIPFFFNQICGVLDPLHYSTFILNNLPCEGPSRFRRCVCSFCCRHYQRYNFHQQRHKDPCISVKNMKSFANLSELHEITFPKVLSLPKKLRFVERFLASRAILTNQPTNFQQSYFTIFKGYQTATIERNISVPAESIKYNEEFDLFSNRNDITSISSHFVFRTEESLRELDMYDSLRTYTSLQISQANINPLVSYDLLKFKFLHFNYYSEYRTYALGYKQSQEHLLDLSFLTQNMLSYHNHVISYDPPSVNISGDLLHQRHAMHQMIHKIYYAFKNYKRKIDRIYTKLKIFGKKTNRSMDDIPQLYNMKLIRDQTVADSFAFKRIFL